MQFGRRNISSFVKGDNLSSTTETTETAHLPTSAPEDKVQPFKEPDWTAEPFYSDSCLEVSKNDEKIETLPLGKKRYYVFGRNPEVCDVVLDHESISRKHAAIVHHTSGKLYLIDLQAGHGTFVDDKKVKPHTPMSLKEGTAIQFGGSTRVYTIKGVGEGKPQDKKRKEGADSGNHSKSQKTELREVRCRHLLVKHKDSRNPSSWKQNKITRSKEEAKKIMKGYLKEILCGDKEFEELATTESDCSSAKRGGDLGKFGRNKMQKAFEDASFALEVGEMSSIVETDSGIHIIQRIE